MIEKKTLSEIHNILKSFIETYYSDIAWLKYIWKQM